MFLSQLSPIVQRRKKRLGRGHGSGRGKTGGRGTKGQKARGGVRLGFEGGQSSLIKRLPLLRGKGKNKQKTAKPYPLAVDRLSALPKGANVTVDILRKYNIIDRQVIRVKLLSGKVPLAVALSVAIPCSKKAKIAIEKAGGKVVDAHE